MRRIKGKSYLIDSFHRFPLTVSPIQGEDGEIMVYLLSASPGLFNGDNQEITCTVKENAHLFLTDPSATELHPSTFDEQSIQKITFVLEKNAKFEYMPQPIIPFKGARYKGKISIHLADGAQAILGEVITAGRIGRDEIFEYHYLDSGLEVFWNDELVVYDTLCFIPEKNLRQKGVFGDYTHMGTLWVLSEKMNEDYLAGIHTKISASIKQIDYYVGASLLHKNGLVIRLLGYSTEDLQKIMKTYWDYFREELFHLKPIDVPWI